MGIFKGKKGLTFVELMVASVIGALVIVGALNLITSIYKGITTSKLKTYSLNLASDGLETLKSYGYYGLQLTPDACLTDLYHPNLSTLQTCGGNPYSVNSVIMDNVTYYVYSYATCAMQNAQNAVLPVYQSACPWDSQVNIKYMHVIVAYVQNSITKTTDITGYLSQNDVPVGGSTISGTVTLSSGGNPPVSSTPMVSTQGSNQYLANVASNGTYTIKNVPEGTYNIIAYGAGPSNYLQGSYASNPLAITNVASSYTGVNISCQTITAATAYGLITYKNCSQNAAARGVLAWSGDGLSVQATTTNSVPQNFTVTNINVGTVGQHITLNFADINNLNPGYSNGNGITISAVVAPGGTFNAGCIQLSNGTPGTASLQVYAYDNHNNALSGITVNLTGSNYITPVATNASGLATFAGIPQGSYTLNAAGTNYIPNPSSIPYPLAVGANNPVQKIYLIPVGAVSGYIYNTSNNPLSNVPVNIVNDYGAGIAVAQVYTNSLGQYQSVSVPVTSGNEDWIKPSISAPINGQMYTWYSPASGYISGISVSLGGSSQNNNFTFTIGYQSISGTVQMTIGGKSTTLSDGVMIVAVPTGNSINPLAFSYSGTAPTPVAESNYLNQKYPYYGTITTGNGTYSISVPSGGTYDVYAFYSSCTAKPGPQLTPTPTYQRYYLKYSSPVSPGSAANFSSPWSTY